MLSIKNGNHIITKEEEEGVAEEEVAEEGVEEEGVKEELIKNAYSYFSCNIHVFYLHYL